MNHVPDHLQSKGMHLGQVHATEPIQIRNAGGRRPAQASCAVHIRLAAAPQRGVYMRHRCRQDKPQAMGIKVLSLQGAHA